MAIIKRYSNTIQGSLIMTGNTLGLLRASGTLNPGTNGSGPGAFITVNTTLTTPTSWVDVVSIPNGENVTYDWRLCSSSAILTIPAGSTVKHAELIWSGLNYSAAGSLTVTSYLNDPITLVNPAGIAYAVTPDTTTKQFWNGTQIYYTIASDVTAIMNDGLSGKYTVNGVPAGLSAGEQNTTTGWILMVAYYNPLEKMRNLNMYVTMEGLINTAVTFTVSGFVTPSTGTPNARVIIAGGDGEPGGTGDYIKMGRTTASLITLSGPGNFPYNFFASQINDNTGNIDTSGTFGNRNAIPGQPGAPIYACRYGWDITNVDASAAITYNQSSAVFRAGTAGDGYYVSAIGIQIDSLDQANFTSIKKSGPSYADVGQTITYTVTARNEGSTDSYNTVLKDTLPNGLTFVSNSVVVNGATVPGVSPLIGIPLGTIPISTSFTVSFQCTVSATVPTPNPLVNNVFATYYYLPAVGAATVASSVISPNVLTQVNHAKLSINKTTNFNYADIGNTIIYTIEVNNSGSTSANNVLFIDTIPNDTTYIDGSFSVNGTTIAGSPNPPGINLGTLPVGITTVSFKVTINTIPTPNPIPNSAAATYNYTVDPSIPNAGAGTANSNIVYTTVNHGEIISSKVVDKSYVTCSDILKYTVVIKNIGNVSASNIVFQDTIPNGTAFINNSFTVNGVTIPGANPTTGVNIATIASGATSTLTFQVVVTC